MFRKAMYALTYRFRHLQPLENLVNISVFCPQARAVDLVLLSFIGLEARQIFNHICSLHQLGGYVTSRIHSDYSASMVWNCIGKVEQKDPS